ncbi:hypothetical protein PCC9214_02596 [Planktothrix tepida]|uniref:Nudix hydrolase domain-containing protein n=2 Tax=Planktothrix TaxID=54304 RepID=A0A1J1LL39_9CYAN|nr:MULTISPECIES: hypothetical protein [Planktothrix]CAD5951696.1 hypothetical protein PCC9214_02596 [Planktothrix tepida]CAD5959053.1 hypothetical protein NO713_03076 [Planktothrix pseudagardhii]CUR32644.1 hypothetical protein PL9214490191 [Planktothrix tepida PCC 9214]
MKDYLQSLEAVINQLTGISQGEKLAQALIKDDSLIDWVTPQQVENITQIQVTAGYGPQNLEGELIDTDFDTYLKTVIQPQISNGIITDGTNPNDYDDRKIRWSGGEIAGYWKREEERLILEVGPTTYPRYHQDCSRSKLEALKLMLKGLQIYQDPFVYFARALAVTVIPITAQGTVYIGERVGNIDRPGFLNFVAGLATFNEQIEQINFYQDAQRELKEEARIDLPLDKSNTRLIGMAGNPFTSETDLVFAVNTGIDENHFKSQGWEEHLSFVRLSNKTEAENLLYEGILPGQNDKKEIIYASRFALKYLIDDHF